MKISKLAIPLLLALLAYFSQAAFLPFHQESQETKLGNKFLDDCVQWGIDQMTQYFEHGEAEDLVPTYNLTSVVANYTFEMWQPRPCPSDYNATMSVFCPYVGEKQILYHHLKPIPTE